MPATMMHVFAGHRLWENAPDEFFLGCIIPDCVDPDRKMKDHLHFRDVLPEEREEKIADFAKKLDIENSDLDFGILWHFYLDFAWDNGPQKEHRALYVGETPKTWFLAYRHEIGLCGSYLANHCDFAKPLWERLRKYSNGNFDDKIGLPKDYVRDFLEFNHSWHTTVSVGPSKVFTVELTEKFTDGAIADFGLFLAKYFPGTKRLLTPGFSKE